VIRTQIYLTDQQRSELAFLSKSKGKKQSELIREAIDRLIEQASQKRRDTILRETAGIWKNRLDIPDFETTRSGWDRG
jgi:predicted DNA-binding protein